MGLGFSTTIGGAATTSGLLGRDAQAVEIIARQLKLPTRIADVMMQCLDGVIDGVELPAIAGKGELAR